MNIEARRPPPRDPDPVPAFEEAANALAKSHEELVTQLSRHKLIRPLAIYHLGVAGQDLIASARLLRETHQAEVERWYGDERHAAEDPSPAHQIIEELGPGADFREVNARIQAAMTPEVTEAVSRYLADMGARMSDGAVANRRFGMVYKSFFYFVRVYQDAIYVVLNSLLGERTPRGSMQTALSDRNPVGAILEREAAGYLDWFRIWRDQRNRWKEGADYHIAGPAPNLGIGFIRYDEKTNGVVADLAGEIVRLPDATKALHESRRAVDSALSQVGSATLARTE